MTTSETKSTKNNYTLILLMLVYTFSFLDRQIISILAEDIKAELSLSDTQLGVLTGLAFALFYAGLGIPIARLADKYNRVSIISISLGLWSAMTMASGIASNYIQLALARVGVGVGEAGAMPASHSMIADMYPPEKRSGAMSVFQLGVPLGILAGFAAGGWLSEWFGWRMSLIVVGAPGLILAIILKLTVKEPKRLIAENSDQKEKKSFFKTVKELIAIPAYNHLCIAATLTSMGLYSIMAWTPALLLREYGLSRPVVGMALALIIGVGGGLGTLLGGKLGDKALQKSKRGAFQICVRVCLLVAPLMIITYLIKDPFWVFVALTPAALLFFAWMGPHWAMVQEIAPKSSRAVAVAFILFILNLIGLGVGPVIIGAFSDAMKTSGMESPLSIALMIMMIVFPWAAYHFYLAGKNYEKSLVNPKTS